MRLYRKPLCFIDTETTGLEPDLHEVIEFAVIRVDPVSGSQTSWSTKIKPEHIERAHPKALEVNGYTPEEWADAPLMSEVGHRIVELLRDGILVGHNCSFDEAMLKASLKRAGVEGRIPYHKVDTVTLAYEHLVPYGLPSLSLDNIRRFLGWSLDGAHTAMQDAEDAKRLYEILSGGLSREVIARLMGVDR